MSSAGVLLQRRKIGEDWLVSLLSGLLVLFVSMVSKHLRLGRSPSSLKTAPASCGIVGIICAVGFCLRLRAVGDSHVRGFQRYSPLLLISTLFIDRKCFSINLPYNFPLLCSLDKTSGAQNSVKH